MSFWTWAMISCSVACAANVSAPPQHNSHIIGGQPVSSTGVYPFVCYIATAWMHSGSICGAVIVDPVYVMTAAHCVITTASNMRVYCNTIYNN